MGHSYECWRHARVDCENGRSRGLVVVIAGVAIGLPSTLAAATLARSQLYGVRLAIRK